MMALQGADISALMIVAFCLRSGDFLLVGASQLQLALISLGLKYNTLLLLAKGRYSTHFYPVLTWTASKTNQMKSDRFRSDLELLSSTVLSVGIS
jgi:hypothetical protein